MGQMIAGFELQNGKSITDLESWPPFVEWFTNQYGWEPRPRDTHDKEIFEAWLAGAHWEWDRSTFPVQQTEEKV